MHQRPNLFQKFFQDKHGKAVLWQMPNVPIVGWAVFSIAARLLPSGGWQQAAGWLSFGLLLLWALLEITLGASYFRRTLGVAVIVWSIYTRLAN